MDTYFNNYDIPICMNKCPVNKKIFLECGTNPQDAIFEICNGYVKENQTFLLDRVYVDTGYLCKPDVKIEFSSLICFEAKDYVGSTHEVEVELLFKLIKTCYGKTECLETWTYKHEFEIKNDIDYVEIEKCEPFTVTFCDKSTPCDKNGACCEYKMIVEGKDFHGKFEKMKVLKPDLSAIAQGIPYHY